MRLFVSYCRRIVDVYLVRWPSAPCTLKAGGANAQVARLVKTNDGDLRVYVDSDFFAEYHGDWKGTPIVWPICGLTNVSLLAHGR